MRKPPIRDRSGQAGFLRSIEAIAPEELTAAVLRVVTDSYGINRVDIPQSTGGLLGFQRISANIRSSLESIIDNLLAQNMLVAQGDFLTVAP
jgi:hypothetical protein